MATPSFQDDGLKKTILFNSDTKDADGIALLMFPDGGLCLEPIGWPDGKMDKMFDTLVLLTPAQVVALDHFLQASRVQNRINDVRRKQLLKNPRTRPLLRLIDKHLGPPSPTKQKVLA